MTRFTLPVIPAKAGTHLQAPEMGPRFRGDDGFIAGGAL